MNSTPLWPDTYKTYRFKWMNRIAHYFRRRKAKKELEGLRILIKDGQQTGGAHTQTLTIEDIVKIRKQLMDHTQDPNRAFSKVFCDPHSNAQLISRQEVMNIRHPDHKPWDGPVA